MNDALVVTAAVRIPRDELRVRASRSGGAGGQHVNTSSTRIEVTWCVRESRALDDAARARVAAHLASRLDRDGCLRVVSSERRSQRQNREAAETRLAALVRRALAVPKRRVATRPTAASVERRISAKKKRGALKRDRSRGERD